MNNYYETCLATLNDLIESGKQKEALDLVSQELRMPYVPEPYFSQFEGIRDAIVVDQRTGSQFFEDVEEIGLALKGNEALQHKALMSLERMNLRSIQDSLSRWFMDRIIPDWIKKQLLFFLMEQDLNLEIQIELDSKKHLINTADLKNPFASEAFVQCELALRHRLESHNPSLLILCVSQLEQMALSAFPLGEGVFVAGDIIAEVERYLGV